MLRIKSRSDNNMMVALRCVFRAGWALPNPVNRVNPTNATRYPFAVFTPAAAQADDDKGAGGGEDNPSGT